MWEKIEEKWQQLLAEAEDEVLGQPDRPMPMEDADGQNDQSAHQRIGDQPLCAFRHLGFANLVDGEKDRASRQKKSAAANQ